MQASDVNEILEDIESAIWTARSDMRTAINHDKYDDIIPEVILSLEAIRSRSAVVSEALTSFLNSRRA